jgi:outer membrane protein assembly factor BamB
MPRDPQPMVFVGIKNVVVALDVKTGVEIWRTKLHGSDFVTVFWDGETLLAGNDGEVFRLDPATGALLWNNELKGLGRGLVTLATSHAPGVGADPQGAAEAMRRRRQAAAAAAAT